MRGAGPMDTTSWTGVSGQDLTTRAERRVGGNGPRDDRPRRGRPRRAARPPAGRRAAARPASSRPRPGSARRGSPRTRNSGPSLTTIRNGSSSASSSPADGTVRMISPAVGNSSLRSLRISMSQSKSAVCARAAASSAPTRSGTGCLGTSNSCRARTPRPASAPTTTSGDDPRHPAPALAAGVERLERAGPSGRRRPLVGTVERDRQPATPGSADGGQGRGRRRRRCVGRRLGQRGQLVAQEVRRRRRTAPSRAARAGSASAPARRRAGPGLASAAAATGGRRSPGGAAARATAAHAPAATVAASAIEAPAARSSAVAGTVGSPGPAAAPAPVRRPRATSGTTGSGGGRSTPPVGSLGRRSWLGSSSNDRRQDERDRRRPGQLLGRPHQAAAELRRREAVGRVRAPGALEHGGERAEVGRHRHQAADPCRQRGDGRAGGERHRAADGLDQDQRQRVHVRRAVDRLAERLLGRAVAGDVGRDGRRLLPVVGAEQAGQAEVDDAQPAVVAEHELRRRQLAVHEVLVVGEVEAAAGLQPDHQGLRRLEPAAPVEEVAQAAAGEVLDDGVDRRALADLLLAPVVDGGDVGVRQLRHRAHRGDELAPELGRLGDLRAHQLDRDRPARSRCPRRRRSACWRRPTPSARRGSDRRAHARRDRVAPLPWVPARSCAAGRYGQGRGLHRRRRRLSLGPSTVAARPRCGRARRRVQA